MAAKTEAHLDLMEEITAEDVIAKAVHNGTSKGRNISTTRKGGGKSSTSKCRSTLPARAATTARATFSSSVATPSVTTNVEAEICTTMVEQAEGVSPLLSARSSYSGVPNARCSFLRCTRTISRIFRKTYGRTLRICVRTNSIRGSRAVSGARSDILEMYQHHNRSLRATFQTILCTPKIWHTAATLYLWYLHTTFSWAHFRR